MHQASVLFLFNDSSALTLNDILRHTKMGACVLLEAFPFSISPSPPNSASHVSRSL